MKFVLFLCSVILTSCNSKIANKGVTKKSKSEIITQLETDKKFLNATNDDLSISLKKLKFELEEQKTINMKLSNPLAILGNLKYFKKSVLENSDIYKKASQFDDKSIEETIKTRVSIYEEGKMYFFCGKYKEIDSYDNFGVLIEKGILPSCYSIKSVKYLGRYLVREKIGDWTLLAKFKEKIKDTILYNDEFWVKSKNLSTPYIVESNSYEYLLPHLNVWSFLVNNNQISFHMSLENKVNPCNLHDKENHQITKSRNTGKKSDSPIFNIELLQESGINSIYFVNQTIENFEEECEEGC